MRQENIVSKVVVDFLIAQGKSCVPLRGDTVFTETDADKDDTALFSSAPALEAFSAEFGPQTSSPLINIFSVIEQCLRDNKIHTEGCRFIREDEESGKRRMAAGFHKSFKRPLSMSIHSLEASQDSISADQLIAKYLVRSSMDDLKKDQERLQEKMLNALNMLLNLIEKRRDLYGYEHFEDGAIELVFRRHKRDIVGGEWMDDHFNFFSIYELSKVMICDPNALKDFEVYVKSCAQARALLKLAMTYKESKKQLLEDYKRGLQLVEIEKSMVADLKKMGESA